MCEGLRPFGLYSTVLYHKKVVQLQVRFHNCKSLLMKQNIVACGPVARQ
jgi:hypothetical protein